MSGPIWKVELGDCVERMAALPEASIDAVVCDPPAGISFMGRDWDHHRGGMEQWVAWMAGVMREALRACKPGGHAVVWALPRTSHWTGMALERAGWEVRDIVTHLFGSGFPKSLNVGDGLGTALKPAAEFWFLARKPLSGTVAATVLAHGTGALNVDGCRIGYDPGDSRLDWLDKYAGREYGEPRNHIYGERDSRTGGTPAGRWPANVLLSHDPACRQTGTRRVKAITGTSAGDPDNGIYGRGLPRGDGRSTSKGDADGFEEVPAFECADDCPVRLLDEQSGERRSAGEYVKGNGTQGEKTGAASIPIDGLTSATYADQGGASRFFPTFQPDQTRFRYEAKASSAERNAGLDGFEEQEREGQSAWAGVCNVCGSRMMLNGKTTCGHDDMRWVTGKATRNVHPTVKPIDLMRWLCRLVCPPGGTILDPFTGSGTTGIAAVLEGFQFIGIERDPEYHAIAEARIRWWASQPAGISVDRALEAHAVRQRIEDTGQTSLL